jgi:purine-binding chemotaxis protein CheW
MEKTETVEAMQYLTFMLAGEEYAIRILQAREIIELGTVTRVPQMPQWVRGVINLRSSVVPVVDLGIRFALAERPVTKFTCIVISEITIGGDCLAVGFIADSVNQVVELTEADIEPVPSFGTQISPDYLCGMGKLENSLVLILDIEKVLTASEISALDALVLDASKDRADFDSDAANAPKAPDTSAATESKPAEPLASET